MYYRVYYSNFSNDDEIEDEEEILDEHEIQCMPICPLDEDYTIELWHIIYGRLRVQNVKNIEEQIDIEALPKGVYILVLKENDNIILQRKVLIQ